MIKLEKYSSEFEKKYSEKVLKIIKGNVSVADFLTECKKIIPNEIISFNSEDDEYLSKLILMSFSDIKKIILKIKGDEKNDGEYKKNVFRDWEDYVRVRNALFQSYCACFEKVRNTMLDGRKMNVIMTDKLGLTICPYCNRDYANSRSDKHAGNQLDHFFSRSRYPFWAVSLYNLVPCCSVCNHIKGNTDEELVSPFDEEYDFEDNKFSCEEDSGEIKWNEFMKAEGKMKNNVDTFRLMEAYKIHEKNEIKQILEKRKIYVKTQVNEILGIMNQAGGKTEYKEDDLKQWIYGGPICEKDYKTISIGKLKHDILKQLNIYN